MAVISGSVVAVGRFNTGMTLEQECRPTWDPPPWVIPTDSEGYSPLRCPFLSAKGAKIDAALVRASSTPRITLVYEVSHGLPTSSA